MKFSNHQKYDYDKKNLLDSLERDKIENTRKLNQQKQDIENEEKLKRQQVYIYSGVLGIILLFVIIFVLFRSNKIKQLANIEIYKQKSEVETQKQIVENKNKEITDSINYAKRIQDALLPNSDYSRSELGEYFILFKPKDIVSGDFYWITKINEFLIVAVADCTGHGVPGAFMSMLGISFLNEIVQKQEIHKANQILNQLRIEIINALQQKGVQGEQKDGMDISLLVVNTSTNKCQWAGANNPLYIIKSQKLKVESEETDFQLSDFSEGMPTAELYELKGDKMPIAIHPIMKDFTNHEFTINKGDSLYLFTDGYADQFGGTNGRKFMYKQFKEILLQNSKKSMIEQKIILEAQTNEIRKTDNNNLQ